MSSVDAPPVELAAVVCQRLRGLRTARGLSLDELGKRSNLSASTISRVETGKRTLSLDVLVALAQALHVSLDVLLAPQDDDDVIIRPDALSGEGVTTWELSRPNTTRIAVKQRIEPTRPAGSPKVHPGYDWFFVLSGTIRLTLGDRVLLVAEGEAAEFDCMVPHMFEAEGGPAEIISIFDRDGQRAHLHSAST